MDNQEIVRTQIQRAMDEMFPNGAGRANHLHVRHWLDTIAQIAFREGETSVLLSLLTIDDAAEQLGVSTRRMRAIAANRHERFGTGWQVPGTNQWLFRPGELGDLAPDEKYRRKA